MPSPTAHHPDRRGPQDRSPGHRPGPGDRLLRQHPRLRDPARYPDRTQQALDRRGVPAGNSQHALVAADEHQPAGVKTGIRLNGDARAAHGALIATGVDAGHVLHWDGVPPMFAFREPDGNGLEIVEEAGT